MISVIVMCLKVSVILFAAGYVFACLLPQVSKTWIVKRAIWVPPFLFVAGMIAPTLTILLLILILFLPIYARSREEAAALFPIVLFSIPFMQTQARVGGVALFDPSTWAAVGIGFFLSTVIKPRTGQLSVFSASIIMVFVLCFLVLTIPSIHGANATSTIRAVLNSGLLLLLPFVAFSRSLSRQSSLHVVVSIALVCFCQAVIGLFASRANWPIYDVMPVRLNEGNWGVKMRGGMLRVGGVMLDSTYFSILLATGITAVLAIRMSFKNTAAYYIALIVMLLGLIATTARGGVLAAGVAFIVMPLATDRKALSGIRLITVAAAYGLIAFAAQISSVAANLTGGTADTAGTTDYRKRLLDRGIEEIQQHPWTGIDSATVNVVMNDLRQGEHIIDFVNGYVMAGVFGGVGALLALIAAFVIPVLLILVRLPRLDRGQQAVVKFCLGIHCATILSCFTTGFTGSVVFPYFLALALTGATLSSKSVNVARHRPELRLAEA